MAMTEKEKLAQLRLFRTENVGPITFYKLLEAFGSAEAALNALPSLAKRGGKTLKPFAKDLAEKEIEQTEKFGARFLFRDEDDYPALLKQIEDAPPVVALFGHAHLLSKPALGVVGARNASLAGCKLAEKLSGEISKAGYVITSGLARGIDAAAHKAALDHGTVAVVAGGIDVIYPRENEKLYHEIRARGAIVAESPFGTEPLARHFPKRNRIISGLSLGVLIVEAALKSGSLITARMAAEQNREVFAIPGSPMDPRAEGTNKLIKDGAHLATSADDILQELRSLERRGMEDKPADPWKGGQTLFTQMPAKEPDENLRQKILETLSYTPTQINDIIRATNAPAQDVFVIILELELAGRLERHPGNKVNLI